MAEEKARKSAGPDAAGQHRSSGFLGSLKDALIAANREEEPMPQTPTPAAALEPPPVPAALPAAQLAPSEPPAGRNVPSAAEAAREVKAVASLRADNRHFEPDAAPTTRVLRASRPRAEAAAPKTQLVRGKPRLDRGEFQQDPVVGWLVVVGGPGLGSFRPVFEGNNTIGRSSTQRVPIDFGDDAISSEEQAYIRYDSSDRSFLFVPNLAKTNVVSINDKRPTAAVSLSAMDVIVMGRTQLVFVPFCGPEFDWAELAEAKD